MAQVPGLSRGLQCGVGGECVAVFHNLQRGGKVGQRAQLQPGRREQMGQFLALLTISGPENQ